MTLASDLEALPAELARRLAERGFVADQLIDWANGLGDRDTRNRITGTVLPFPAEQVSRLPAADTREHAELALLGAEALSKGSMAICVLAGGMATRMGGVVKALVEVAGPHTFLDLRLAERAHAARTYGAAPALWLMTSEPTDGKVRDALAASGHAEQATTFEQLVSLRLDAQGELFLDDDGRHSVYATGHGDLPQALRRSGLLQRFVDGGGRYVLMCNLDNLGARIDAAVLGQHIASGAELTVELVDKVDSDKGGGPVVHDGKPIICENFRLPLEFDPDSVPIFNTNTFTVDAEKLLALDMDWTYVEVHKQVGSRMAVQFERLLGEITVGIPSSFLWVPRDGESSRFLPVKSAEDLQRTRDRLESLARRFGLNW